MPEETLVHPFAPLYDSASRILILGSFPSVASREISFYYGHPRNRFWKVLEAVLKDEAGSEISTRKAFLLRNRVALWDVIGSCRIVGSADSSITDVRCNDIGKLLADSSIEKIFVNGRTAEKLYRQYVEPLTGISCIYLPSTSPANAAMSLERLIEKWQIIRE